MRIVIRVLGQDLLEVATGKDADQPPDGPGSQEAAPVGFRPSYGDQRWEKGPDFT